MGARVYRDFRWGDVRDAGSLGLLFAFCFFAFIALALYAWIVRQAGCTQAQAIDPRYACPSGVHVATEWALIAAGIAIGAAAGVPALYSPRRWPLVVVVSLQVALIAVFAWIAQDAAFHVHLR